MKHTRRRRHLRPRPSRAQLNQQLNGARRLLSLCRAEWVLEAQHPEPRGSHLRFLHDRIGEINDELAHLEAQ
jgi:hypothetical protein